MSDLLFRIKKMFPRDLFLTLQPSYHFLLALWSMLFYGLPSRRIKVVGVTGTNGKTTVVELVHEILQEAGIKAASISSLRFKIGDKEAKNDLKMTMPGRMFIQRFLHQAVRRGCQYAILEVTSEGIRQSRHRFIKFDVVLVTNISPEHIESHGSFEKYLRSKLDPFWRLPKNGTAIINKDDKEWHRFSAATAARKIFFGRRFIEINGGEIPIRHVETDRGGVKFEIEKEEMVSDLNGEFNLLNVIAAVAFAMSQHISLARVAGAVKRLRVIPGRMEYIQRGPFTVVVDYAHTPDSLRKVYETLRSENLKSATSNPSLSRGIRNPKLICVLGSAGGGRDKWKRPEFGKIAAGFCDEIILTNEDPYDENQASILRDIETGFSQIQNSKFAPSPKLWGIGDKTQKPQKVLDRRKAIRKALKLAEPGDVVAVTGKGAEPWIMGPDNSKTPWDDRNVVREELSKL